jgi:hypothetical protein
MFLSNALRIALLVAQMNITSPRSPDSARAESDPQFITNLCKGHKISPSHR